MVAHHPRDIGRRENQICASKDQQWYTCTSPSFAGCCSINPCQPNGCPDKNTSAVESKTTAASSKTTSNIAAVTTYTSTASDGHKYTSVISVGPSMTRRPEDWYATPSTTPTPSTSSAPVKQQPLGEILGGVLGGVALLAILAGLFFLWRARRGSKLPPRPSNVPLINSPPPNISLNTTPAQTPRIARDEQWPYPGVPPTLSPGGGMRKDSLKLNAHGRGPSVDTLVHPAYVELPTSEHTEHAELPGVNWSPVEKRGSFPPGFDEDQNGEDREIGHEEMMERRRDAAIRAARAAAPSPAGLTAYGGGYSSERGRHGRSYSSRSREDLGMEMQTHPHSPLLERNEQ